MVTAAESYYGGSLVLSPSADLRLRLPKLRGGCRFYELNPSSGGLKVVLPDARKCDLGGPVFTLCNRHATNSMTVYAQDAVTVVATLAADSALQLFLAEQGSANGVWHDVQHGSFDRGSTLTLGREPWFITISSTVDAGFDCRAYLDAHGYEGVNPVALVVTVAAAVTVGAPDADTPALTTGEVPAGSTCLLTNHGIITGKGGDGGKGGEANPPFGDPAEPGAAGGIALRLRCDTALVNYGTIAGGGGGGGGGAGSATQGGGGGGGGAGLRAGLGGAAPFSGGAIPGGNGGVSLGGIGGTGANAGGAGGTGGTAGNAGAGSGGAAGAAGDSIRKKSGITLTKVRTGTILGAEAFEA